METRFEVGKWYKFYWSIANFYVYGKIETVYNTHIITSSGVWMNREPLYRKTDGYELNKIKEVAEITDLSEIQQYLPDGHIDKVLYKTIPEYVEYIDTKYKGQIVKVEDWEYGSYCKVIFANGDKREPFKHLVKPSTKEEFDKQNEKWIPRVGDWVVALHTINPLITEGKPYKLKKVDSLGLWHICDNNSLNGYRNDKYRKALPHEIPDDFVLPEKWCIKWINEEVFDACKKYFNRNWFYCLDSWCISNDYNYWSYINEDFPTSDGYTEITLEQFKKYVLKEDSDVDKVIKTLDSTGYILTDVTSAGDKYYLGVDSYEKGEESYDIRIPEISIPVKTPIKVVIDSGYPEINIKLKPKKVPVIDKLTIKPINILVK